MNNRGFSLSFATSLDQFKKQEQKLLKNLENAMELNKYLILNTLFSSYYSSCGSIAISPNYETHDSFKNLNENILQEPVEERKQKTRVKLRIKKKRQGYDTKNIPKNFGTAINIFIKRNSAKVKSLLSKKKISYSQFYHFNKEAKEKINSLLHLRELWEAKQNDKDEKIKQCYRIISFQFMRKHCLSYIFGSRIKNTSSHIRYRKKLLQGIERPHMLFNLKDY